MAADNIDITSGEANLERADYTDALIRSYRKAIEATSGMFTAMMELRLFSTSFCSQNDISKMMATFFSTSSGCGYSDAHNEFAMEFQKHAWNTIFAKTKVSGLMTEKVREKFNKWREEQGGTDLNRENIFMFFEAIIQQRRAIADECIVDAFDKITQYGKNNHYFHWKTNSSYIVPNKFIIPCVVEAGWSNGLSLKQSKCDFLNDIDRAFCLVSGKTFPQYGAGADEEKGFIKTMRGAISDWCKDNSSPAESEFFTFQCFKAGTVHFKVKDATLLAEFNKLACLAKGMQLPDEEFFKGKARRSQDVK